MNRQRVAEELLAMADDLDAGVGERLRGGWKVTKLLPSSFPVKRISEKTVKGVKVKRVELRHKPSRAYRLQWGERGSQGRWKVSAYDVGGKTAWTWEDAKELISEARGR